MMLLFAFGCFLLALILNLVRLITAQRISDRILVLDTMVINCIALIILYGIQTGRGDVFELALLLAVMGFVSTVGFCKFLLRGTLIE